MSTGARRAAPSKSLAARDRRASARASRAGASGAPALAASRTARATSAMPSSGRRARASGHDAPRRTPARRRGQVGRPGGMVLRQRREREVQGHARAQDARERLCEDGCEVAVRDPGHEPLDAGQARSRQPDARHHERNTDPVEQGSAGERERRKHEEGKGGHHAPGDPRARRRRPGRREGAAPDIDRGRAPLQRPGGVAAHAQVEGHDRSESGSVVAERAHDRPERARDRVPESQPPRARGQGRLQRRARVLVPRRERGAHRRAGAQEMSERPQCVGPLAQLGLGRAPGSGPRHEGRRPGESHGDHSFRSRSRIASTRRRPWSSRPRWTTASTARRTEASIEA